MKITLTNCVLLLLVWTGCDGGLPQPLDPVHDQDAYSRLARALRERNLTLQNSAVLEHIDAIRGLSPPDDVIAALDRLAGELDQNPDDKVSQTWASRVLIRAYLQERDTVYIFYGNLSDVEIEQERSGWNRTVEQIMPWRGYRVVIDRDATFEEWRDAVLQRDAAGIIWRSHGNLSPSPYEPDDSHFMARVLSAGGSREKLFAGDWRALLPEGLGLLVLASCMTNGIYLPEDFKLIEDRRGAKLEDARISTFETEVGDRALHYRGYRGPSFSPGIGAEAWFTLRRFLPARICPGELGENPDLFPDDFPGAVEHGVVTIEWIPHLVDALAAADSGRQKKIQAALGALSLELGEEFQSGDPGAWREWWNRPGVQAAFSQHALVAESRPPGDLFWAGLWSAFETERDRRGGIPQDGPDCWQAWFHCIFDRHHLPESVSSLGDQIVWQLTIPSDSAEQYPCPLPRDLVVSYHPATGELSHNLAEIMDGLRVEDLECASLY